MTKDVVKQLRIKSNAIKTCRFWQRLVTNLLFSSIYTLHSNSLPTSIPDILSASCQSPLSLCIQIVRFQNDGKKLGNLIDYQEKVFFRTTITIQTNEPQQLMPHINWKLSLSMKAPRFPLVITFVTSKEEMSGIFQAMPLSASLQLWKPQAKKHTSFSMRKMTLKTCKRLDTFLQCRAI